MPVSKQKSHTPIAYAPAPEGPQVRPSKRRDAQNTSFRANPKTHYKEDSDNTSKKETKRKEKESEYNYLYKKPIIILCLSVPIIILMALVIEHFAKRNQFCPKEMSIDQKYRIENVNSCGELKQDKQLYEYCHHY